MSVEIQFVGGPADGTLLVIPATDPTNPPKVYDQLITQSGARLTYRRTVNPGDDGPLWHYIYEGEGMTP